MRLKHHIDNLICAASDEPFVQDAVEFAILANHIKITGDFENDLLAIFASYDQLIATYHHHHHHHHLLLQPPATPTLTNQLDAILPLSKGPKGEGRGEREVANHTA